MKKLKVLSLVMCVCMLCLTLTGCYGGFIDISINEDGSGQYSVFFGTSETTFELLKEYNENVNEDEDLEIGDINEFEKRTYNDVNYYGETQTNNFSSVDEFNEQIADNFANMESYGPLTENFKLSKNEDGSFVLKFGGEIDDLPSYDYIEEQMSDAMGDDPTSNEEFSMDVSKMEKAFKEYVSVFEIQFPYNVKLANEENIDGVVIDGKKVTINFVEASQYFVDNNYEEGWIELVSSKEYDEKLVLGNSLMGTVLLVVSVLFMGGLVFVVINNKKSE